MNIVFKKLHDDAYKVLTSTHGNVGIVRRTHNGIGYIWQAGSDGEWFTMRQKAAERLVAESEVQA